MDFLDPAIEKYIESHTSPEPEILKRIGRETHLKVLRPRMLSGHVQGRLLSLFSKLKQPTYILEIGTYTGYSAICLSEGIAREGKVITIEKNEELKPMIADFIRDAGLQERIELVTGDAREIIPKLNYVFDMVFIDADKEFYSGYYDMIIDKVSKGGLIIADNTLWSGKVVEPVSAPDKSSAALIAFNQMIQDDPRVENILLPVRDGLMIIRKL